MADYRTSQAPFGPSMRRLPEDDLPEIDWGGAEFTSGGAGPEPEPMPDPDAEARAMARLRARIAERDAAGIVDPWAQAQAVPLTGPQSPPLTAGPSASLRTPRGGRTDATGFGPQLGAIEMGPATPAAPPMTPQQAAQAAYRQPALDAVRAGVGAVTPPPDPTAPPPQPTAPDAVPTATTDPNAPTVTAGSQAAGLAQRPPSPTTAPTAPPQSAKSMPTGPSGIQARMGAGPGLVAQQPSFDERLESARAEDARRERIRRIILGAGALLGAGTGNMGLMLPAAIGAGLVRDPDEEATLRANDERAQAVGGAQAEQRAMLEQLAMRRAAQQAQERQGQQTLALRARELEGAEADRGIRTGLQVTESERESAMLDPGSDVSERNRMQFREWLRTSPREIQQAVDPRTLDALSATEILTLQDELSSNYNSRQIGGGRGGGTPSGVPGGIAGLENAPAAFVAGMAQANGENPSSPSAQTRAAADAQWRAMRPAAQAAWAASPDAQRLSQVVGRSLPGYEQAAGGAIAAEQYQTARDIQANLAAIGGEFDAAIGAAEEIQQADIGTEVRHRFGDFVGLDTPQVARFNAARASIIATMNRLREAGVMNESEYTRGVTELRALSDPRNFISDSTLRLRSIRDGVMRQAEARMNALGYRRGEGGGTAPTTTADAPPAPEREVPIVFRVRLPDGRVQQIRTTPSRAEADQARARERGWEIVQ